MPCLFLILWSNGLAQCHAPHFRLGKDFSSKDDADGSLWISIGSRDFTVNKLTCLVQDLRKHHPNWTDAGVFIFGSHEAAKYFQPPVEGYPPKWPEWAKQFRALYSYNVTRHEEYLTLLPLGYGTPPALSTRIDLPFTKAPHCKMEMNGRCLIAVPGEPAYPEESLKARLTGEIVLTGIIRRNGKVTGVRVAEGEASSGGEKNLLMETSIRNLRSWQFDPAPRDVSFNVAFVYAINPNPSTGSWVKWDLPAQLTIWGNPNR